jgi:hypothetical protein
MGADIDSEKASKAKATAHPGSCVCNRLTAALDRQNEAHWQLHQLNEHYHQADAFRYSLNAFIRVIKEIPGIVQMQLQREYGFKAWFRAKLDELHADPLFSALSKHRDFIVHQGMLKPSSYAHIGTTRDGLTLKIGFPFPADVFEDSDDIMARFVRACQSSDLLFGLAAAHGDDSQVPCVRRAWHLAPFPDVEVRALAIRAWKVTGALLSDTLTWLGHEPASYDAFPCLPSHESPAIMIRMYEQSIYDDVVRMREGMVSEQ